MFELRQLPGPIVQAPMGGDPSTPKLAIAVSRAGRLGFLAGDYQQPTELGQEIDAVAAAVGQPFGVKLVAAITTR